MLPSHPSQRFSNRVDDYARYRPRYPEAVLRMLVDQTGLTPTAAIADVGSGTGLSAELFLRNGNTVYGVEPNAQMRAAGEALLAGYAQFHSIAGTAEATTLPDSSVDFVVAGQAFHWFDRSAARAEFVRILRPPGWVALFWNTRREDASPFMREYEALLRRYGREYHQVCHTNLTEDDFRAFFADGRYGCWTFPNPYLLDFEALRGRTLSTSYMPAHDDPVFPQLLADLHQLFETHQEDGEVRCDYETQLYLGQV